ETLAAEHSRVHERFVFDPAILDGFGAEQVDPFTVRRVRDLSFIAAIAAEKFSIARYVEVNRPLVPLQVIPGSLAIFDVIAGQPEHFAARSLQIVPDRLSIHTPEFMTENLHRHGTR